MIRSSGSRGTDRDGHAQHIIRRVYLRGLGWILRRHQRRFDAEPCEVGAKTADRRRHAVDAREVHVGNDERMRPGRMRSAASRRAARPGPSGRSWHRVPRRPGHRWDSAAPAPRATRRSAASAEPARTAAPAPQLPATSVKLTACRVCPEGKLNRSSGRPTQMMELCVMNGRSRTRMRLSLR